MVILKAVEQFKKSIIEDGEEQFTDKHIFEDCCFVVRAIAKVYCIVIDKETGEQVKDANIQFALLAVDDSDKMDFVKMEEE